MCWGLVVIFEVSHGAARVSSFGAVSGICDYGVDGALGESLDPWWWMASSSELFGAALEDGGTNGSARYFCEPVLENVAGPIGELKLIFHVLDLEPWVALAHYREHFVWLLVEPDGGQFDVFIIELLHKVFQHEVVWTTGWELVGAVGALVFGTVADRVSYQDDLFDGVLAPVEIEAGFDGALYVFWDVATSLGSHVGYEVFDWPDILGEPVDWEALGVIDVSEAAEAYSWDEVLLFTGLDGIGDDFF